MHQAVARASGEYLLFTDADILYQRECLSIALAEMEQHGFAHKVAGVADSPPREEGWPRHEKKGPVPKRRGRGGRSHIIFQNAFLKWDL